MYDDVRMDVLQLQHVHSIQSLKFGSVARSLVHALHVQYLILLLRIIY